MLAALIPVLGSSCNNSMDLTQSVAHGFFYLSATQESVLAKQCLSLGCRAIKEVLCAPPSRRGLTQPLEQLRACIREAVDTRWVSLEELVKFTGMLKTHSLMQDSECGACIVFDNAVQHE